MVFLSGVFDNFNFKAKEKGGLMKLLIFMILFFTTAAKAEKQFSFFGFSVHAVETQNMTGAIDDAGILAFNPQLNYFNADENGKIFHVGFLQDCFRHPAGFIAWGRRYEVDTNLFLGYEVGVYARQVPKDDDLPENRFARVGIYQVVPTPAFILQYRIAPKTFIRVQSNLLVNFIDIGLEF